MHTLICGRARKNIKLIESATNTAIYFPPPFPRLYGYTPPGAIRRPEDEIIITGENPDDILQAKRRLHDLVLSTRAFVKEVIVTTSKIDSILLERLDKVRKIIENNGSYILLPPLGFQRGPIRVQGTDVLNVERTVRELMALVCFHICYLCHSTIADHYIYRLANSTAPHGASPTLTLTNGLPPRTMCGPCCRTSASTLVLRLASRG